MGETAPEVRSGRGIDSWTDDLVQRLDAIFPARSLLRSESSPCTPQDCAVSYVATCRTAVPSFVDHSFTTARRRTVDGAQDPQPPGSDSLLGVRR